MIEELRHRYEHTIYASYIGYITQAIVNNFAPLLFLTFASAFHLKMNQITLLITVNFCVQLLVDLLSAKVIDRVGYRRAIIAAHVFATIGLLGLAFFPYILTNQYLGLMLAVILYAIGGGIIEVLISPIVESCPTSKKEAAMSLLHSFYCWGQVSLILFSTVYFKVFGIEHWRELACILALIPLINCFYFSLVPIYPIVTREDKMSVKELMRQKTFWIFAIVMICAGASELAMSQWASTFAEKIIMVPKATGDLIGPCAFAVLMGISRAWYGANSDRVSLKKMMVGCAILCVVCYLVTVLSPYSYLSLIGCAVCGFSVGIFWPGTFSLMARVIPNGGTALYAFMAFAGDIGCSLGPTMVGMIAAKYSSDLRYGLGVAILFPIIIILGMIRLTNRK